MKTGRHVITFASVLNLENKLEGVRTRGRRPMRKLLHDPSEKGWWPGLRPRVGTADRREAEFQVASGQWRAQDSVAGRRWE